MTAVEYFGEWSKVIDLKETGLILKVLDKEYAIKNICPDKSLIFKAFKSCSYDNLKVIILSQDPYFQKGVSTGIAFGNSSKTSTNEISPSLRVLVDAVIDRAVPHNHITFDYTLESWESQGVLLLNSALTVEMNRPGTHTMLWRPFISKLLVNLSKYNPGLIYVLLGNQAQTFKPYIDVQLNIVLTEHHPAYYARNNIPMPHTIFEKLDKILYDMYGESIIWYNEY